MKKASFEWNATSEEGNKYRIYNDKTMNKHEAMILTEERPNEKIDVEAMNSSYVNGLGAGYRFTIEEYGYDRVKIRDEEHRKTYDYKISLWSTQRSSQLYFFWKMYWSAWW